MTTLTRLFSLILLLLPAIADAEWIMNPYTTKLDYYQIGVTNGNAHDHNGGDGAQISYITLGNLPTLPQNESGAANNFLTAYNSTTGAFSKAQPAFSDLSGRAALNQITDNDTTANLCLVSGGAGGEPNYITCPGGGGGAPVDGEYVTYSANATLSAERVLTSGTNTTVDLGTAGQAKINVVDASTTVKGVVELATDGESAAGLATQSNDSRLSNARTPTSHDDTYHTASYSGVGGCPNQFARTLNDNAAPTCAPVDLSSDTAATALPYTKGGTGQTTAPDNNMLIGNGGAWELKAIPECTSSQKPQYTNSTNGWTCVTDLTGGGGGIVKQVEVDFGATPVRMAIFTISDGDVSGTSKIFPVIAYEAPTGKYLDELEFDSFTLQTGQAGTGTFKLVAHSQNGLVAGKFKINYSVQ